MAAISSVCVYCGSRVGHSPEHAAVARRFGQGLADAGLHLVYGGGHVGLMGVLADAALARGGTVTGIIPRFLSRLEVSHQGLTETLYVETMHERKKAMADRADSFVVLPGGFGTIDELIDVLTWKLLGLHDKPILIVNQHQYWAPLVALFDHLIAHGFAAPEDQNLYRVYPDVDAALAALVGSGLAPA